MTTIHKIKELLEQKKISAVEITQEILNRLDSNPFGATLCINREASMFEAKNSQKRLDSGEKADLLGIPIMHKDVLVTKEWFTTAGSKFLKNYKSPFDASVVEKLKNVGMICLGKTSCDEFAMGSANQNCAYNDCCNPWDQSCIPGGSSGGSAAVVAAGIVPAATGTDTGGSIRQPSAMCGVTGLKPTYGRVSRWGIVAYASSLDQAGPIAKSAKDCAYLLDAMSGFDPKDSTSLDLPSVKISQTLDDYFEGASNSKPLNGLKFGVPEEFFSDGLENDVAASVNSGIREFEKLGAELVKISLPATKYAVAAYYVIAPAEASSNLSRYDGVRFGQRADDANDLDELYVMSRTRGFGSEVRRRILIGTFVLSHGYYDAYYLQALKVRRLVTMDFEEAFKKCDLVIGPTCPNVAWKKNESPVLKGESGQISGVPSEYLSDIYTVGANLGGFPAISVPCGFSNSTSVKKPIGLQLIGPKLREEMILKCAHFFQMNTDWHKFSALFKEE